MSAEPSLHHTDVASDAPAVGDAGKSGIPGGDEQPKPRNRRNRRGRRRRGRRAGRPTEQAPTGEAPATGDTPAEPGPPKPSDLAARANTGAAASTGKPQSPNPQSPKPQDPKAQSPKAPNTKAPGAKTPTPANPNAKTPHGKAMSQSGKGGPKKNTPASMPRTKRRNGRRPSEAADGPRLRTVRETSAGGLVLADLDAPFADMTAALIGRVDRRGRTMWSLPKGHIETGETAEQTAMREVAEETGISGTVVAPLGKIDYWFVSEGRRIHKTVHHYLLRFTGGELSDEDYEVSEVAWVPLTELPRRLTYSDERRLARMAESVIADLRSDPNRLAQSEASCVRTEPNEYEKAAAARNQRRNEPPPPAKPRRRRRRPRRSANGDS